jgi:hypothetical protein
MSPNYKISENKLEILLQSPKKHLLHGGGSPKAVVIFSKRITTPAIQVK